MPLVTLNNKTKNIPIPIDLDDFDGPANECRDCTKSKDPRCCVDTECWEREGGCANGCELANGPGTPCQKIRSNINPNIKKCGTDEYKNKGCWVWDDLDNTCITYGKNPDAHINCEYAKCTDCFSNHPMATKIKKIKSKQEADAEADVSADTSTSSSSKSFFTKPEGIISSVIIVSLVIAVVVLAMRKK